MEDIIQDAVTTSKIYIEVDDKSRIVKVFSSVFEEPTETSILLEEGHGDRFAHAHLYFEKPIYDMGYTYKYVDGEVIERTEEEIQGDITPVESQPTELEVAQAKIKELEEELLMTNQYLTDLELLVYENILN